MESNIETTQPVSSPGKRAFKKALIFSIPVFILNYIIVSNLIQTIGLPFFLSHYQTAFYVLFNIILDVILFNIILMQFHKLEKHR
ncbi:hypothetical protein [Thiomicrorhabdus sp. Milos-T2]|uniref:hypothetical protein n=1 Tax=Thiomicrorhabdus sp. Milos-T2 TaxID=90814 RepID=UPI0004944F1A|nr:hypothetical protein [Thiomicrorhabdus sp. Milos-T2]